MAVSFTGMSGMAKRPSIPSTKKRPQRYADRKAAEALDLDPDAWPKFEDLIRKAAKVGPAKDGPKKRPAKT